MKKISYRLMTEINIGTEEEPNIVQTFNGCEILCNEDKFEANLAIAQGEAYNGEISVEDIPDEEADPTVEERLTNVEQAMDTLLGGGA